MWYYRCKALSGRDICSVCDFVRYFRGYQTKGKFSTRNLFFRRTVIVSQWRINVPYIYIFVHLNVHLRCIFIRYIYICNIRPSNFLQIVYLYVYICTRPISLKIKFSVLFSKVDDGKQNLPSSNVQVHYNETSNNTNYITTITFDIDFVHNTTATSIVNHKPVGDLPFCGCCKFVLYL